MLPARKLQALEAVPPLDRRVPRSDAHNRRPSHPSRPARFETTVRRLLRAPAPGPRALATASNLL